MYFKSYRSIDKKNNVRNVSVSVVMLYQNFGCGIFKI